MTDAQNINRRDFVNIVVVLLGSIMGAVVGLPAIAYLVSPATKVQKSEAWISTGNLQNYPLGTPTLFSFNRTKVNGWEKTVTSYGVYVNRIREDQVKVYSNVCPHLACRVTWNESEKQYVCPCHDGRFDIEGKVVSGPPPAPLQEYAEIKVEEGNLYIHFTEG